MDYFGDYLGEGVASYLECKTCRLVFSGVDKAINTEFVTDAVLKIAELICD